jgi:hypothetical protein
MQQQVRRHATAAECTYAMPQQGLEHPCHPAAADGGLHAQHTLQLMLCYQIVPSRHTHAFEAALLQPHRLPKRADASAELRSTLHALRLQRTIARYTRSNADHMRPCCRRSDRRQYTTDNSSSSSRVQDVLGRPLEKRQTLQEAFLCGQIWCRCVAPNSSARERTLQTPAGRKTWRERVADKPQVPYRAQKKLL